MKKRNIIRFLAGAFIGLVFYFVFPYLVSATYNYDPMEPIPGFETDSSDFPTYALNIYKFGIWVVGICALLMITVGGFMYLLSAGNTAKMDTAKKIIMDSVLGLIIALGSYFLLFIINPDLVNVNISLSPLHGELATSPSVSRRIPSGTATPGQGGTCSVVSTGPCSVDNLRSNCFTSNAEQMSQICNQESRGNPANESGTDRCKDGSAWSIGLFQVNMISSAASVGCNGKEIFEVNGNGPQGTCLERRTNSSGLTYCAIRDCRVINQAKYQECYNKLRNGQTNIQIACTLSRNGTSYSPWINSARICKVN